MKTPEAILIYSVYFITFIAAPFVGGWCAFEIYHILNHLTDLAA